MEAQDWGGLWVFGRLVGSSVGGALRPGEAIPVSDGYNQPARRQLIKSSWTWRLYKIVRKLAWIILCFPCFSK